MNIFTTGHHVSGQGKASRRLAQYEEVFGCPMVGTFNVVTKDPITTAAPAFKTMGGHHQYWLVRLAERYYGWAIRWNGTGMGPNHIEILSRRPFPVELKKGELSVEVFEPWPKEKISAWANSMKWFQSFTWSPKRADSESVWRVIEGAAGFKPNWRSITVLDVGCNFGYFSFAAAKAGAEVVGFDKNSNVIGIARTINDHIEMQDVQFEAKDPGGTFDVILYLSVHHQRDKAYEKLAETIEALRRRARKMVFVELIVPPLEGTKTAEQIGAEVGGRLLLRYHHAIRAERNVYCVEGKTR
jgi:SAM-dependent methyltransferase